MNILNYKILPLLLFLFPIFSCNTKNYYNNPHIVRSIYIDANYLTIDYQDMQYFEMHKISNLYIYFFNIKWDEIHTTIPKFNDIQIEDNLPANINIIPVVKIDNEIFQNIDSSQLNELAAKIIRKINYQFKNTFYNITFDKYVIECYWTSNTKNMYFAFLTLLQQLTDKKLSVTIKPQYISNKDTLGIPPTNNIILNCYNFTDIDYQNDTNYIFDKDLLEKYIIDQNYPKKLTLGLPAYSCGIVYTKEYYYKNRAVIENITETNISQLNYLKRKKLNPYIFTFTRDTIIKNYHIYSSYTNLYLQKTNLQDIIYIKNNCKNLLKENYEAIIYYYDPNSKILNDTNIEKIFSDF